MSTQTIREPLRDDENLENLLEEIGEANSEAEAVGTLIAYGEEKNLIMVEGVDDESVELPEKTHGFDLSVADRFIPEDEETIEKIVEKYDEWEKEDFEPPFEPAWIKFEEPEDGEVE
ncbi:hypothetical protein ACM16X_02460 [Haloarcula japonica]|uniref:hypothetical protein n=1 Tax=Haloarcula japonica TaxID=29282 RepID=UPI0039F66AC0